MQLVTLHWEPTWLADFLAFDKLTLQSYLPRLPSLQALLQAERPSRCKMKGNWQLQREGLEQRFQESLQGGNLRYLPGADGKVAWADLRADLRG